MWIMLAIPGGGLDITATTEINMRKPVVYSQI